MQLEAHTCRIVMETARNTDGFTSVYAQTQTEPLNARSPRCLCTQMSSTYSRSSLRVFFFRLMRQIVFI